MNLITRYHKLICTFNIDPDTVVRVNDITGFMNDKNCIVGTVVKSTYRDLYLYAILFISGRHMIYKCNDSKTDIVRVIRMMKHDSFKSSQISQILGISEDLIS